MKIGYFTDTYYPQLNGVAVSVDLYTQALRKAGHTVYLIAPALPHQKSEDPDTYLLPSAKAWYNLPDSVRIPLPLPSRNYKKILELDYDIIHAHGNGVFSLLGLMIAKRKKVPYILTVHTLLSEYTHYFFKGKVLKPTMMNSFLRTYSQLCDRVITPSKKMRDQLLSYGVKKRIVVLPNFVPVSRFGHAPKGYLHEKLNLNSQAKIILSVGRLGKEKNFEFIIRMFSRLTKLEKSSHLVIVGEGVDEKKLKKLVHQLKLSTRIHFTGGIPIDDMPNVYADADLFVFASTSEVHPLVTMEAAASGLPLILAEDPAYSDIIKPGVNGYSLPLDYKNFVQKSMLLLSNETLRKEFSVASRKIAQEQSQERSTMKKLIHVYEECVDNAEQT